MRAQSGMKLPLVSDQFRVTLVTDVTTGLALRVKATVSPAMYLLSVNLNAVLPVPNRS